MLLQEQIMKEINGIPPEKLSELYDLIHYFRLGLLHEKIQITQENQYPLRGKSVQYHEPFEPAALSDWDVLK
ncbi:MAG: hypothetical protein IPN42_14755 [Methylococcaceae bacterium]|nr:hypothetical protein [Methylococcaceae bacterium]